MREKALSGITVTFRCFPPFFCTLPSSQQPRSRHSLRLELQPVNIQDARQLMEKVLENLLPPTR